MQVTPGPSNQLRQGQRIKEMLRAFDLIFQLPNLNLNPRFPITWFVHSNICFSTFLVVAIKVKMMVFEAKAIYYIFPSPRNLQYKSNFYFYWLQHRLLYLRTDLITKGLLGNLLQTFNGNETHWVTLAGEGGACVSGKL